MVSRLGMLQQGPEEELPPHGDPGHEVGFQGQATAAPPPDTGPIYSNIDRASTYDRSGPRGPYARDPYQIPMIGDFGSAGTSFTGVNMDDYTAVTREVQPEELTSYQLQSLLAGDSAYMQNARRRGIESAAERGAFGSSLMAESSMRAAIDAAEPIARADAAAYIQAASENLQVVNANINTKLQAATSLANNMNSNRTNIAIANLRERANAAIAQAQIEAQFGLQERGFQQSVLMERLQQDGRLELANLNADLQRELQANGFENAIYLNELDHEQMVYLERTFNEPRFQADYQLRRAGLESQMIMNVMNTYAQFVNNMNGQDLDQAAYQRGMDMINNWVSTTFDALGMVNLNFNFGTTGSGSNPGDEFAVNPPGGG